MLSWCDCVNNDSNVVSTHVLAACVSKYSGGCMHYFRALHTLSNMAEAERFEACLRRYISRKIGFESVMRIRCTRGQLAEYEVSAF